MPAVFRLDMQDRRYPETRRRFLDTLGHALQSGPQDILIDEPKRSQEQNALLAVERLTGQPVETYQNAAMQRGIETEAEARDAYSFAKSVAVEEAGFVACDDLPNTGCSPDGIVGDNGLVELKCPASMAKHLDALRTGAHATEYRWQLQHQLMVTGRQWVDAASYDPRFPEHLQLAVKRVERDEAAIAELRAEIIKADAEVTALVDELNNMEQAA